MQFPIKKIFSLLSLTICILIPFHFSFAQNFGNIFEPSIEINLSPENPGPNTQVTATLITNSFDINTAFIGWAINGKVVAQGVGERNYTFQTGDSGQIIQLEVILQSPDTGDVIRRKSTIIPADLEIIWESQGYTPPFYEGKSHPVLQSTIVFTAIPHIYSNGNRVSSNDLVYTWSKNKTVLQSASGYGKDTVVIVQDFLSRPFRLDVIAKTRDNQVIIEKSVFIDPQTPQLVLYEEDPLLGFRLGKGFTDSFTLQNEELWLRAVPYFVDTTDRNNGLFNATWRMNGQNIKVGPLEERLVLRRPPELEDGRVNISLTVENDSKLLQSLQNSFSILIEPLANNPVF